MDEANIDKFLKENCDRISLGLAASTTRLTKETVRRRWKAIRAAADFIGNVSKEPKYEGTYVNIPQLKARVKLKPGQTVEQYIAKTKTHGMMTIYRSGSAANREKTGAWSSQK